ncbi:hypothetical protein C7A09_28270, partial [Pseudomonas fluorescens]
RAVAVIAAWRGSCGRGARGRTGWVWREAGLRSLPVPEGGAAGSTAGGSGGGGWWKLLAEEGAERAKSQGVTAY